MLSIKNNYTKLTIKIKTKSKQLNNIEFKPCIIYLKINLKDKSFIKIN